MVDGLILTAGLWLQIPDIYNVQPELGFYCLYRPRPGENISADTVVCENITGVARQHAGKCPHS